MVHFSLLCTLILALALAPVNAFWILSHHPLVTQRLDAIVSPNALSSHVHSFVGSAAVSNSQMDVRNEYCTTAPVKADLSNYWTPQLYYYYGDSKTFASVPLGGVNTYYLNRGGPKMGENASLLQPFPMGLKMLAGSAMNFDGPNADPIAAKAVSFVCLNYTGSGGSPQTTTLPKGVCRDGMRAQIIFPSCWDGVNLDSANHQSHVSYPVGGQPDSGDCPSTHPVKFMTLFYEFIYNSGSLQSISNGNSSSGYVFSNGDAVGYSFHGDFVSAWDETVLRNAITQCAGNLFGDLASCPPFVPSLHYETSTPNSDPSAGYCTTNAAVNERVLGANFTVLPNCQVVRNGPFKGAGNCSAPATVPTISVVTNSTGPTDASYRGCYKEPKGGRALTTKLTKLSTSNMTIAGCRAGCATAGFSAAGLEYASECWCGNAFAAGTTQVKDEFCNMACTGNSTEMCGGSNIFSAYSSQPIITLTTPTIPASVGLARYWGCYKEATSGRLLTGSSYANTSNTPTQCAAFCTAKGFPFSGTEYTSECYCGTSANMAKALVMPDTGCNMLCSGNATSYCGGSSRLQIYSSLTNPNATSNSTNTTSTSSASISSSAKLSSTTTTTTTTSTSSVAASSSSASAVVQALTAAGSVSITATTTTTPAPSSSQTSSTTVSASMSPNVTSSTSNTTSSSTRRSTTSTITLTSTSTTTIVTVNKSRSSRLTTLTSTRTRTRTTVTVVAANTAAALRMPTISSSTSSSTKKRSSSKKKTSSTSTRKATSTSLRARSLPTRLD